MEQETRTDGNSPTTSDRASKEARSTTGLGRLIATVFGIIVSVVSRYANRILPDGEKGRQIKAMHNALVIASGRETALRCVVMSLVARYGRYKRNDTHQADELRIRKATLERITDDWELRMRKTDEGTFILTVLRPKGGQKQAPGR